MSDWIYETVRSVSIMSSGSKHTSSMALPIPSKAAIVDSYTYPESQAHRPSLSEDVVMHPSLPRPPLPPRCQRLSNSEIENMKSMKNMPDRIPTISVHSTELSLTTFVDKYSSSFPQRVKVTKGFYGVSDKTTIATGDEYNLHILKCITVILATDTKGLVEYGLPLKSSLKLALLYDPTNGSEDPKTGTVFDTVADLLDAKVLPHVVAATRQFSGGSQESSVDPNEVFVLIGPVEAGGQMASKDIRQLKVHSITHSIYKSLPENCACLFTTSLELTGAPLSKLCLQNEWLPLKAIVCCDDDNTDHNLPPELTLVSLKEELIVLATGVAGTPSEVLEVIELPKNLDIEVELLPISAAEMRGLIDTTKNVYETFTPTSVIYYTNKPTPKLYDIPCALNCQIKEEYQRILVQPSPFDSGHRKDVANQSEVQQTDVDDVYITMNAVQCTRTQVEVQQTDVDDVYITMNAVQCTRTQVEISIADWKMLSDKLANVMETCSGLQAQIKKILSQSTGCKHECGGGAQ